MFSLTWLMSCQEISGPYYYRVASSQSDVPGVMAKEVEQVIRENLESKEGPESYCAEVSIVRYSSGKETYSFSGSEEGIAVSHGDVMLEVMVRIKKHDTTLRVFFISSGGADKSAVLIDMVKKLGKELNTEKKKW